ncbi:MAG: purine-binding chemotaxis protein CheW [Sulfuriflexus sp.]|nr:purine-binding chemotaxis protein CheW [Sulfuriflexus sp.]
MLLLGFNIDNETYVIDTCHVIEVTPLVRLKTIPGSSHGVCGLLNYHGTSVPVVDINLLCAQHDVVDTLTTRIIIVNYNNHTLGIKAGSVTETIRVDESEFKESGIKINGNDFLGKITEYNNRFLQLINPEQLLTDDIRDCLFPKESEAAG